MWKLLKYEFRRARTSLLTVLGVIAVLEMYFLISLGVDHMEHVVIAAVLMMFASYGAAVYIFVRGVASYASELKAKSAYVGDTNNYDAGLKKSPFTGDDKIIVSSDKKVEAGDTVREK